MRQILNGNKPPTKIMVGGKGISVVEILVVMAILGFALASLLGLATFSLKSSTLIKEVSQANFLARETIEAVRNFRDGTTWNSDGLGTLSVSTDYYPQKSGSPLKWQFIQGVETINGFSRKVVFENAMRDGANNIVPSGGTIDPNTKKVISTVSWKGEKVEIITYFTNWQ